MDAAARERLRIGIEKSSTNAARICKKHNWPANYVGRVLGGKIAEPAPSRLLTICGEIGEDLTYILTGERAPVDRQKILDELANASDDALRTVSEFVRQNGLEQD